MRIDLRKFLQLVITVESWFGIYQLRYFTSCRSRTLVGAGEVGRNNEKTW